MGDLNAGASAGVRGAAPRLLFIAGDSKTRKVLVMWDRLVVRVDPATFARTRLSHLGTECGGGDLLAGYLSFIIGLFPKQRLGGVGVRRVDAGKKSQRGAPRCSGNFNFDPPRFVWKGGKLVLSPGPTDQLHRQ